MSFGDLYTVPRGSDVAPGLPPVDLPQAGPPPLPARIEIRPSATRAKQADPYGHLDEWKPPAEAQPKGDPYAHLDEWKPDETSKPLRDVTFGEGASRGIRSGTTFGLGPALAGIGAASGNPPSELAYPEYPGEKGYGVGDTLKGAANLFHEQVIKPFLGQDPGGLTGQITGEHGEALKAYHRGRQAALDDENLAREQQPLAFILGQLGGTLMLPGMGVAGGAGRATTTGGRILTSMKAGGIGGGLYGAGESVSRGEGPVDVAKSGGIGGVVGGVLGGAGSAALEGIGGIARTVIGAGRGARNVDAEAARRITGWLGEDTAARGGRPAFTPEEVRAANAAGTPRGIVDVGGELTRAGGRSAANTSPAGRQVLDEFTQNRFHGQATRIAEAIQRGVGGGNSARDIEAIEAAARRANRPAYARAYGSGQPINSARLTELMQAPAVQAAMRDATTRGQNRAIADGLPARFTPQSTQHWDYVARELSDTIGAAQRAGRNEEAGALTGLRRELLAEVDRANPAFGRARQGAATFFGATDAMDAGRRFVMGMNTEREIGEAQRAIARMSRPERELFARGFGLELANKVLGTRDAVNVVNQAFLDSPRSVAKIRMALGPQRAGELEALLRVEGIVDRMRQALGNSTTVRQAMEHGLAGAGAVGAFEMFQEHGVSPSHLLWGALVMAGARHGANVIDQNVARRVAEMLTSNDPEILRRGAQIAARSPVVMNAMRRATSAGARIMGTHPEGAAAGVGTAIMNMFPEGEQQHSPHQ